ncbi:MAG: hypothetical protein JO190_08730 [Candidatus Eremiobacteraeota bacterium]|nr:hypothetical protein [Candidatus Eremiobacteraeota bacterium]
MQRLGFFLSALIPAVLIAGCSGNAGAPTPNTPGTSAVPFDRSSGMTAGSQLLHFRHTPAYPPPRRHRITSADRARALAAGWTPITNKAPWTNGPFSSLLMTDGTVMVHDYCTSNWYSLAPDKKGSYINGTWTKMGSLPSDYGPLYYASAVLPDGKLIINGGEYNFCHGDETNLGAIYDPATNAWTAVAAPSGWGQIGDAQSVVLSNGTYMIGNCCTSNQAQLNESSMTWTQVGTGKHDPNSEEGWTLLRNGDVLTADVIGEPNSEYFNPTSSTWQTAGTLPVNLTQCTEIGPQSMRPNNTIWVAGASGLSAIYNTRTKAWTQGPSFPAGIDTADSPSSVFPDGQVMTVASPGCYNAPATAYIFNGKKLKNIAAPPNFPNDSSYMIQLLVLPTGQTMETDWSSDVEIYTGGTRPYPGIAPTISSVPSTLAPGTTYTISGKRFNGYTQANFYGDDATHATNYPLVRVVNSATGDVFYCKTHNHSYMGIGSNKTVSTMFDVPSGIETGASTIYVVVNGIVSAGVSVTIS